MQRRATKFRLEDLLVCADWPLLDMLWSES